MSYDTVVKEIKSLPEEYLDEVAAFVNSLLSRGEKTSDKLKTSEGMELLNYFAGSVSRNIDYEKEKMQYLDEKYGNTNWYQYCFRYVPK